MKIKLIGLSCLVSCVSVQALEKPNQLFSSFNSDIYAEAQPIKSFVDKFDQPLTSGDSAFTFNLYELGVNYQNFSFGVQSRFDYIFQFHEDTALYTYIEKNDLDFEDRNYIYRLKAKNATSHGLFFSYRYQIDAFTIVPNLSVFGSKHFQDGDINGYIYADQPQGAFNVDYAFSKDRLFKTFSPDERPKGLGASLDLAIEWQYSADIKLGVAIKDLFYRSEYDDAGFVDGNVNDIPFVENRFGSTGSVAAVSFKTSGNDNEKNHRLRMPARYFAFADYRINPLFSTRLSMRKIKRDNFFKLIGRWHFADNWALFSGYESKSEAWTVGIDSTYTQLSIQADTLDLDKAYALGLRWDLNVNF